MAERFQSRGIGVGIGTIESTKIGNGPQCVNRRRVQADRIHVRIIHQLDQRGDHVFVAALDEQSLRVIAPQHIVALQRGDQLLGRSIGEIEDRRRFAILIDQPIHTAVALVAMIGRIGTARTTFKTLGNGVVLNDDVVPVDHPDLPIGADGRRDRGGPLIIAGEQVELIDRHEPAAARFHCKLADQMPGWLGDEIDVVPVERRIGAGGVKIGPGPGGVPAMLIDLANFFGDRVEMPLIPDVRRAMGRPTANGFKVAVRYAEIERRVVIGGGGEKLEILAHPNAPGVVIRRTQEF